MFSFAMTSGLASDSDKFKIILALRWAQKISLKNIEIRDPTKISIFGLTHQRSEFLAI